MKKSIIKRRTGIPKQRMVLAKLQKENKSCCPFCTDESVEHFQVHHIDENPSNNDFHNLILVCPTCHSKITKGEITKEQVREKKNGFNSTIYGIEIVSINIDEANCCWHAESENIFFKVDNKKWPLPILAFTVINHSQKTVVLKNIRLIIKHLPRGLSGIPKPQILKSLVKYRFLIYCEGENIMPLASPLKIPSNDAAKFDVEVFSKMSDGFEIPPSGRSVLYFTLDFNSNKSVKAPSVFLNCKSENDPLIIRCVS